jgi:hypothetical protein
MCSLDRDGESGDLSHPSFSPGTAPTRNESEPERKYHCPDSKLIKPLKILPIQIIPSLSEQKNTFPSSTMFGVFSPRHPKSSSSQKPWEDIWVISAVFAGSVIREGFGKLSAMSLRG